MVTFGDYEMNKATKARIEWKLRRQQCLTCSNSLRDDKASIRGLCGKCANKWKVAIRSVPVERRKVFDDRKVDAGLILPSRRGRRAKKRNPFL